MNNQAENLALYQGLKLLKELDVRKVMVIGDVTIIIQYMRVDSSPKYLALRWVLT
jgi:ribonuclease HI